MVDNSLGSVHLGLAIVASPHYSGHGANEHKLFLAQTS